MHRHWSLLVLLLALAGCHGGKDAKGPKQLKIAVIPKGTTHEFWKSVHAGALKAAKEIGNVEIIWKSQLHEDDREGQIDVLQNFIAQEIDGIVLAPLDERALVPVVASAAKSKIPVVIFDSGLEDESNIVSYVATDNYHGGELAARELGRLLKDKGRVIMLRYHQGSESTTQRERGFLESLQKEFPGIEVLSSDQYSGTKEDDSLDKSVDMLRDYGEKVDGIFTVCEPNTVGMLKALEQEGLAGKVKFIGFDPSPRLVKAMADGKIHGIVLQDPVNMGYKSVKALVAHLQGQKVSKRIPTGEAIATPDNMESPIIKNLLEPEQAGQSRE